METIRQCTGNTDATMGSVMSGMHKSNRYEDTAEIEGTYGYRPNSRTLDNSLLKKYNGPKVRRRRGLLENWRRAEPEPPGDEKIND